MRMAGDFRFRAPAVGAKLVLPGRHQDGRSLAHLINAERVTVAAGVATVWLGLADHLDQMGGELPSLRADHARRIVGPSGVDGSSREAPRRLLFRRVGE